MFAISMTITMTITMPIALIVAVTVTVRMLDRCRFDFGIYRITSYHIISTCSFVDSWIVGLFRHAQREREERKSEEQRKL